MQWLWCWRCKAEMPMLDEGEYAVAWRLYGQSMKGTKEFRGRWGVPLEGATIEERFKPVRDYYEQVTGMKDCHENAVMHHKKIRSMGRRVGVAASR